MFTTLKPLALLLVLVFTGNLCVKAIDDDIFVKEDGVTDKTLREIRPGNFKILYENLQKSVQHQIEVVRNFQTKSGDYEEVLRKTMRKLQFDSRQPSLVLVLDLAVQNEDFVTKLLHNFDILLEPLPVYNYVAVLFNEKGFTPSLVTTDLWEFLLKFLDYKNVYSPKPRRTLSALQEALEVAMPYSSVFVITDNVPVDSYDLHKVQNLAEMKQSSITFVIDAAKVNSSDPKFDVFKELAKMTNGNTIFLTLPENYENVDMTSMMSKFFKIDMQLIDALDLEGESETELFVDSSISEFTVAVMGKDPKLSILDPMNQTYIGSPDFQTQNMLIFRVLDATTLGKWTISTSIAEMGFLRIFANSLVRFRMGFSAEQPKEFAETFIQPRLNAMDTLTVLLATGSVDARPSHVVVEALEDNFRHDLKPTESTSMFVTQPFYQPNLFRVYLHGTCAFGLPMKRLISTYIRRTVDFPVVVSIIEGQKLVIEEDNVELKCAVSSISPVDIVWKRNNTILKQKSANHSTELVYRIQKTNLLDTGEYTCEATNQLGLSSKRAQLGVVSPILFSKQIQVTINRNSSVIHEGVDSIEIDCLVTGLFTNVFWQFNDTSLSIGSPKFDNKLTIEKASRNNTGRYTCVAQNEQETALASVDIVVYYSPEFLQSTETNVTVYSGDSVTLNCEADGKPQPFINWIHIGPQIFKPDDSSKFTLDYDKVNFTQDGRFECIVSNDISPLIVRTFYLTVIAEKEPQLKGVLMVLVQEGQAATLTCQCEACKPIREHYWSSPSKETLMNSTNFQVFDDRRRDLDTLTTTLLIPSTKRSDSGVYECHVTNDRGTGLLQIKLLVEAVATTEASTITTTASLIETTTSRTVDDLPMMVESSLWWMFLVIAGVACGVLSIGFKICINFCAE